RGRELLAVGKCADAPYWIVAGKLCSGHEISKKMPMARRFESKTHSRDCAHIKGGSSPRFRRLLVLPIVDQVVDYGRICQRRGVAEIAKLVFSDFAQNSPHDLARTCFWQARGKLDQIGRGDWSDFLTHPTDQLLAQLFARLFARHQRDIGID